MTKKTRTRRIAYLSFGLLLSFSFISSSTAIALSDQSIAQLMNNERAAAGLSGLQWNGSLSESASLKVADMCAKDYWSHNAPDGTQPWVFMDRAGYPYRAAGENLANGYASDSALVAAWMASPTHRDNVLSSAFRDVGVASMQCVLQGLSVTVVVAHYGSTAARAPASTSNQSAAVSSTQKTTTVQQPQAAPQPVASVPAVLSEEVQPKPSTQPAPTKPTPRDTMPRMFLCNLASVQPLQITLWLFGVARPCQL